MMLTCTIRWRGRYARQFYLNYQWKQFFSPNGFRARDRIGIGVSKDMSSSITIIKISS